MLLLVDVHPKSQKKIEREISCKCLVPVNHKNFQKGAIHVPVLSSLKDRGKNIKHYLLQLLQFEISMLINSNSKHRLGDVPASHIA